MPFFMMYRHPGDEPGFPVFFDRQLDRESAGSCIPEGTAGECLTNFSAQVLTFRCKHKWLSFDFDNASGAEYFFSQRLWGACKSLHHAEHKVKLVRFVTMGSQPAAESEYLVVRFPSALDAVDTQRSVIVPSEQHKFVKVTKHLALDKSKVGELDLFRIRNMTLGSLLFCSERFKSVAMDAGAKLQFIAEDEAAEVYLDRINPLSSQ